jgi:hypothetical protein
VNSIGNQAKIANAKWLFLKIALRLCLANFAVSEN